MTRERILRGIPVSPGIVLGGIYLYTSALPDIPEYDVPLEQVEQEVRRWEAAVTETRDELARLRTRYGRTKDITDIISVLLLLLEEADIRQQTIEFIRQRRRNAEFAYSQVTRRIAAPLAGSQVAFVREKIADINDITQRVLRHLLHLPVPSLYDAPPGAIIIAQDLLPSETTTLDSGRVGAVALEAGGKTTHAALMLKAKEIPLLVGIERLVDRVQRLAPADAVPRPALLDAYRGLIIISPSPRRLEYYKQEQQRLERRRSLLFKQLDQEPVTSDGRHIDIMANAELPADCDTARRYHARGIGLFRSEYLILAKRRIPDEQEQYELFAQAARTLKPYPVVIRTFDLGGDKVLPGYTETNPFLGWRAIRYCLDNQDFFKTQLRAILRASALGNVRLMFPMIATLEELRRAKLILNQTRDELRKAGVQFDEQLPIGCMVEIPSAALLASTLARETDFLSIGSNDLTQYTLAVDRGNQKVARLYDPLHPAVLRLIKLTIDAAHDSEITAALCGELASDPFGLIALIGLGIDELSMVPAMIPQAIAVIRALDRNIAREIAQKLIQFDTPLEVHRHLHREIHRRLPDLANLLPDAQ